MVVPAHPCSNFRSKDNLLLQARWPWPRNDHRRVHARGPSQHRRLCVARRPGHWYVKALPPLSHGNILRRYTGCPQAAVRHRPRYASPPPTSPLPPPPHQHLSRCRHRRRCMVWFPCHRRLRPLAGALRRWGLYVSAAASCILQTVVCQCELSHVNIP